MGKLIGTREAAEILQCNRKTVARWIARGILTGYRCYGTKCYKLDSVEVTNVANATVDPHIAIHKTASPKVRTAIIRQSHSKTLGAKHGLGTHKHLYSTRDQQHINRRKD